MKLIKMTSFVLGIDKIFTGQICNTSRSRTTKYYECINKYANFLNKPLGLGMFVPCVDGEPLEEKKYDRLLADNLCSPLKAMHYKEQYQKAKEQVLFEGNWIYLMDIGRGNAVADPTGFTKKFGRIYLKGTIEDLIPYNLTLTETAKKMIL